MHRYLTALLAAAILVSATAPALARPVALQAATQEGQRLRVFLDCQMRCDFDHLRREVGFVSYVRDRQDAQVHVIATERGSAAGEEVTLSLIGREDFAGVDDEFAFANSNTDTDAEQRDRFARYFAQGLARYLARTSQGGELVLSSTGGDVADAEEAPGSDPWNYWVYRVRGSTEIEAEDRQDELSFEGSISASRTTEQWKIRIGLDGSYDESDFEFDDGETLTDVSRRAGFGLQVIRSLGDRWGAGVGVSAAASTYSNLDPSPRIAFALERNLFPYSESSRREMTFTYFVGLTRFDYREETLFEKLSETVADHGLIVAYDVTRPWGDAGFDVEFAQFLDDFAKLRLELRGNIDYRIVRGLSVFLRGSAGLVRDQRFLPLRGATAEEVLLQRRALATDARWGVDVGFSFTFGSIYNSVVNTRFSGSSGGFHRVPGANR